MYWGGISSSVRSDNGEMKTDSVNGVNRVRHMKLSHARGPKSGTSAPVVHKPLRHQYNNCTKD